MSVVAAMLLAAALQGDAVEITITLDCGSPCSDDEGSTRWERPLCTDYDFDEGLIENIERGDRSAIVLAEQRFAAATTYAQKQMLAAALLRRVRDDAPYWTELYEHAKNLVAWPRKNGELTPEFIAWCEARELPPDDYRRMIESAFIFAAGDPRARTLVRQALESDDVDIVRIVILYQLGTDMLPAIAKAIGRFPEDARSLASELAWWHSEAADEIAFRFLDDEEREDYRAAQRDEP